MADLNFDDLIPKKTDELSFDDLVPKKEPVSGSILPFTRDENGVRFDSNAGFIGSLKSAVTLPGDVYKGKVDPRSDEAIERSVELAGAVSPVGPASRAAKPAIATISRQKKIAPPSSAQLKEAAQKVYEELGDAGVEYGVDSVDELARVIQERLAFEKGIGDKLAPRTYGILRDLQAAPEGATSVPFTTGLNSARKQLGRAASKGDLNNPEDPAAAGIAARAIMDFMERPPEGAMVSGPPAEKVAKALKNANANYSAAKRSELLGGIEDNAELKAAAANSGKNIGNTIRQRAVGLLQNKSSARDRAGFTEDELQAIEKIARGTAAANITRDVGNTLGGGGGLGALATGGLAGGAGFAAGGLSGATVATIAAMLAGRSSKAVSNSLTKNALRKVDQTTRKRSPLFAELQSSAPVQSLSFDQRKALADAIRAQLLMTHGLSENIHR